MYLTFFSQSEGLGVLGVTYLTFFSLSEGLGVLGVTYTFSSYLKKMQ